MQYELHGRGVLDSNHLKHFVAQAILENGALDPLLTTGDRGCSIGIPQYNTCVNEGVSAKTYLSRNPEWRSTEYQVKWLANRMAAHYKNYGGDIRRAVVHHNRPVSARANKDSCMWIGERLHCYFRDGVLSRLKLLTKKNI